MPDALRTPPSSETLETLGRYQILAPLGVGGMAELFLARARGPGGFEKLFAIKRLRGSLPQTQHLAEQMLNEARIVASLHHTNIVQVFEIEVSAGRMSLVMEYLHGRDLRAITRAAYAPGGPGVPLSCALAIVGGMCAGLHFAHEQRSPSGRPLGIVHRDVSLQNVIVTFDGGVKVIDFGIAKAASSAETTACGTIKGTPGYMSPEQCRGLPLDRRSDVFGIAVVLYTLTTGRRPYDATGVDALFDAVLETEPIPPSRRRDGYPAELERIVLKGLARDRAHRYTSAKEMQRDLEAFAARAGLHLTASALEGLMATLFGEESSAWRRHQGSPAVLAEQVVAQATAASGSLRPDPADSLPTVRCPPPAASERSPAPREVPGVLTSVDRAPRPSAQPAIEPTPRRIPVLSSYAAAVLVGAAGAFWWFYAPAPPRAPTLAEESAAHNAATPPAPAACAAVTSNAPVPSTPPPSSAPVVESPAAGTARAAPPPAPPAAMAGARARSPTKRAARPIDPEAPLPR